MGKHTETETSFRALVQQHGSVSATVDATGISKSVIYRRLQEEGAVTPTAAKVLASAKAPPKVGMEALLAALVESQSLMARLLMGQAEPGIVVPDVQKVAKAPKAAKIEKPTIAGTATPPEARTLTKSGRRFIVSSAQNNTTVHPEFWASLQVMARHVGAEIIVSRYTYNKNAFNNGAGVTRESTDVFYAPELEPYLTSASIRLAPDLLFCGEVDRLPTAVDPLSGLDSYTRESSGIFGHPKVALRSMPVMAGQPHRMLYSTGTVTMRSYVDRLAGQKAAFHHTYAALYIEIDEDGQWFARQLVASDNGEFQDLSTVYTPRGFHQADVAAVIWGDLHAEKLDDWMPPVLWGQGGIRDMLKPGVQVVHDAGDFRARNHHNIDDPYFLLSCLTAGISTVEGDFQKTADILSLVEWDQGITIVPDANHMLSALMTWLKKADFRRDPANMRYFLELSLRLCQAIENGEKRFDIYEWALRQKRPLPNTVFLKSGESYKVCGIELGLHGHQGPNGSRGSPKGFRQMGTRVVTGHSHSCGIVDGVWTAGVSGSLNMGYNEGPPSSWSHSHVIVYESGKRAIITMRGPRWRGKPITNDNVAVAVQKLRVRVKATSVAA